MQNGASVLRFPDHPELLGIDPYQLKEEMSYPEITGICLLLPDIFSRERVQKLNYVGIGEDRLSIGRYYDEQTIIEPDYFDDVRTEEQKLFYTARKKQDEDDANQKNQKNVNAPKNETNSNSVIPGDQ